MRSTLLLIPALLMAACATAEISGELSADGSCSATIEDAELTGPEGGVRLLVTPIDPGAAEGDERYVIIVYCRLTELDEEPARIDFVKLHAPADGILEPGTYTIDRDGNQPRTIGVVVTAPAHLDARRAWQPIAGTLEVAEATESSITANFEMVLRQQRERIF